MSKGGDEARDAARYRWLRSEAHAHADNELPYPVVHRLNDWGRWSDEVCEGEQLDAAIDKARAAAPAEQSAAMPERRDAHMSQLLELAQTVATMDGRNSTVHIKKWARELLAAPAAVQTKGKDDSPVAAPNSRGREDVERASINTADLPVELLYPNELHPGEWVGEYGHRYKLATPQTAAPAAQPEPVWPSDREWIIREGDLLHLMSVKIGAAYVTVEDAAKRTNIAVRRLTAAPPPAAQSDEARSIRAAAETALAAYQHRFESVAPPIGNFVGPIDEEMTALRAALAQIHG